jgi:hypothetical protein
MQQALILLELIYANESVSAKPLVNDVCISSFFTTAMLKWLRRRFEAVIQLFGRKNFMSAN